MSVGLSLRVGPHAATLHTDVLAKGVGGSLTNPSWKVIWPKSYFFFFIYFFLISLTSLQNPPEVEILQPLEPVAGCPYPHALQCPLRHCK